MMASSHPSSGLPGPDAPFKRMRPRAAAANLRINLSTRRPQAEPEAIHRGRMGPRVDQIARRYETAAGLPPPHPILLDMQMLKHLEGEEPPDLVPSLRLSMVRIPKKLRAVYAEKQRGRTSTHGKLVISNPSPWFRVQRRRSKMFRRRGKMLKPVFLRTMCPQIRKHTGPLLRLDEKHPGAAFRLLSKARAVELRHRRKRVFHVLAKANGFQCNAIVKAKKPKKPNQPNRPSDGASRRESVTANQEGGRVPSPLREVNGIITLREAGRHRTNKHEAHKALEGDGNESDGSMYSDAAAETQAPIPQTANVTRTAAQETRGGRISLAPYVDWLDILQSPLNPYSDAEEPIPPLNPAPTPRSSALSSRTRQSVRASLIPFRDCVVVFNSRIADRGTEDPREPEPVEPLPAIYSSRLSSVLLPPRAVFPYPSSSYLSTPPPIPPQHPARLLFRSRPSHSTAATMDQNSTSDPFVESNNNHREGLTEIESQAPPSHPENTMPGSNENIPVMTPSEDARSASPAVNLGIPRDDVARKQHSEKANGKGRGSGGNSRIPRPPAGKQSPNLGPNAGKGDASPDNRSSIPVAIRKQSEGQQDSSQGATGESGGVHGDVIENSPSVRLHPVAAVTDPEITESAGVEGSSSSEYGDYDADEIIAQRPTGLTGEHRVRPRTGAELLAKYGAQLKIANSAERLLLGDDQDKSEGQASQSSQNRVGQSSFQSEEPRSQFGDAQSPDPTGDVSTFSRPQDILPRANDLSGRERALSRRLRHRPVLLNFENSPPVPKIPEPYASEIKGTPQSDRSTGASDNGPDPFGGLVPSVEPFTLDSRLGSHPPRTESLGTQGFSRPSARTQEGPDNDLGSIHKKSETTFDDFVEDAKDIGHGSTTGKMPESKGTRMLDSFRHMFGKKAGAERSHSTKNLPAEDTTKRVKNVSENAEPPKIGLVKKAKWNKSTRSLRAEDISSPIPMRAPSMMPSPASYSSIPTFSARGRDNPNYPTPSFARPTRATRTRAAAVSTKQTPPSMEPRLRRPQGNVSNGSPQRLARSQRRTPQTQTRTSTTPMSARSERPQPPEKDTQDDGKMADSGEIGIRGVVSCTEDLIAKVCDDSLAAQREKHLRLMLSLQQQLNEYRGAEKEMREMQSQLSKKKSDKGLALSTLMEYLGQVRLQLEED